LFKGVFFRRTLYSLNLGMSYSVIDGLHGLLGRPNGSSGGLIFCLWYFFISPSYLRARRETLPHDGQLAEFYNAGRKIRGEGALPHPLPQKKKTNMGPKTCNISVDFIQAQTLIANISTPQ